MQYTRLIQIGLALCLSGPGCSAMADDADKQHYNQVQLSVQAKREVRSDLLSVTLFKQAEGRDTRKLSEQVNRDVKWAIDRARKAPRIKVETLDYRTTPLYKKGSIDRWQVRQSIRLESQDTAALSDLVGELQQHLNIGAIQYQLSPELLREMEDTLIDEALETFRQRASRVARQLGSGSYRLVQMNIGTTSNQHPTPMPRMARLASAEMSMDAAPSLEPGEQTVRVSVSGSVELDSFRP